MAENVYAVPISIAWTDGPVSNGPAFDLLLRVGVYPRPGPARQGWDTETFIDWGVRLGRESDGWDKRQRIENGFIYDTAAPGGLPAPSEPPGKGVVFYQHDMCSCRGDTHQVFDVVHKFGSQ